MKPKHVAFAVLVAFLWSLCFPLIETGHRAAPPLRFAAYRSFIAALSLLLPSVFFGLEWIKNKRIWKAAFWIALTYSVMGLGGMFLADSRVPPGVSTVLANTQPIIAVIFSYLFLKEIITRRVLIGLAVCFAGIGIIALESYTSEDTGSLLGMFYIMIGALGTGAGNTLMKLHSRTFDPKKLLGLQFLIAAAILYSVSLISEVNQPTNWHTAFFWSLVVLAIPGTALVTVLWYYLLRIIELNRLVVYTFLTPVFGILIGVLLFNERMSFIQSIGIAFTLMGTFIVSVKAKAAGQGVLPRNLS